MEKQKKSQNKTQLKKHLKTYIVSIDATKELGLDIHKEKKITIPIFISHKGCKNECVFCNQRKISGQINPITADEVKQIIDKALKSYINIGCKIEVAFFGGSFTGLDLEEQKKYLNVVKPYIDNNIVYGIRISTRPDYISKEILNMLKEYNVKIIELGVQSMDDEVLKLSKRGHTESDVIKASELIKKNGFVLGHQMMIGLPGSTLEKEEYSIKQSIELSPHIMRLYPVYVLSDSELYDMYKRGTYSTISLDEAVIRTKIMYKECVKNKINVIRIGLQTTDEINQNNELIYGPVCDNYRERVLSSIMRDIIISELESSTEEIDKAESITINIPKVQLNYAIGNNKCNKEYLQEKFNKKIYFKCGNKE